MVTEILYKHMKLSEKILILITIHFRPYHLRNEILNMSTDAYFEVIKISRPISMSDDVEKRDGRYVSLYWSEWR